MKVSMKSFIILVLLWTTVVVEAATIKGSVKEHPTKDPLIGASIQVKGTTIGAITDIDGHFELDNLKEGNYTLSFVDDQIY